MTKQDLINKYTKEVQEYETKLALTIDEFTTLYEMTVLAEEQRRHDSMIAELRKKASQHEVYISSHVKFIEDLEKLDA